MLEADMGGQTLSFFVEYSDLRDLHSFPTRRSSDLDAVARARALVNDADLKAHIQRAAMVVARSEEHTSELQSRQYLVCRLLLEKKTRLLLQSCHVALSKTAPMDRLPSRIPANSKSM